MYKQRVTSEDMFLGMNPAQTPSTLRCVFIGRLASTSRRGTSSLGFRFALFARAPIVEPARTLMISCTHLVVKVVMPGASLKDIALDVTPERFLVRSAQVNA